MTDKQLISIDSRELATVLAGLRFLQHHFDFEAYADTKLGEHFADCKPLNDAEISALCERINCSPSIQVAATPAAAPFLAPNPYIELDCDEFEGTAECGCRLVRDERQHSGATFYQCALHRYAADLREACERSLRVTKAWQEDELREHFGHGASRAPVKGQCMAYDAATQEVEYLEAVLANVGGGNAQKESSA